MCFHAAGLLGLAGLMQLHLQPLSSFHACDAVCAELYGMPSPNSSCLPLAGLPFSLLCLANNCAIGSTIGAMQQRFQQLYRQGRGTALLGGAAQCDVRPWPHHVASTALASTAEHAAL